MEEKNLTLEELKEMDKSEVIKELKRRLENFENEEVAFEFEELKDHKDILKMREMLKKSGVIFIKNVLTKEMKEELKEKICEAYKKTFKGEKKMEQSKEFKDKNKELKEISMKSFEGAGIMAAKSSGMMYRQPLTEKYLENEDQEEPSIEINSHQEIFEYNTFFPQVNMWLLSNDQNEKLTSMMLSLSESPIRMLSVDSIKIATNFKNKSHQFTKMHIDHYHNSAERIQMLLNLEEEKTKLFYCPGCIDPNIKTLIEYFEPNFYQNEGFKAFKNTELISILKSCMIAPPPNTLICWSSGIPHAEFTASKTCSEKIKIFYKPSDLPQEKDQLVVRLFIGNHSPTLLSIESLVKIALLSENHQLVPSRYKHNKDSPLSKYNKMNKGNTMYKNVFFENKELLKENSESIESIQNTPIKELVSQFLKLDPNKKTLYGVPSSKNFQIFMSEDEVLLNNKIIEEHQKLLELVVSSEEEFLILCDNSLQILEEIKEFIKTGKMTHSEHRIYVSLDSQTVSQKITSSTSSGEKERYRRLEAYNQKLIKKIERILSKEKKRKRN